MKYITLQQAIDLIDDSYAVAVWGRCVLDATLIYPETKDVENDDESIILTLNIREQNIALTFAEGDNKTVQILGDRLRLIDTIHNPYVLCLLDLKKLEE